ncbi:MAG: hypothetical protein WC347_11365 [Smithellaceae bacterium]|jgi:hypothetical protein
MYSSIFELKLASFNEFCRDTDGPECRPAHPLIGEAFLLPKVVGSIGAYPYTPTGRLRGHFKKVKHQTEFTWPTSALADKEILQRIKRAHVITWGVLSHT